MPQLTKKQAVIGEVIKLANLLRYAHTRLEEIKTDIEAEAYVWADGDFTAVGGADHLTAAEFSAGLTAMNTTRGTIDTNKSAIYRVSNKSINGT